MSDKLTVEEIQEFAEGKRICLKHSSMALATQFADIMRENERLRGLLCDAADELRKHWFSDADGESYNNEGAISLTKQIEEHLAPCKESENG